MPVMFCSDNHTFLSTTLLHTGNIFRHIFMQVLKKTNLAHTIFVKNVLETPPNPSSPIFSYFYTKEALLEIGFTEEMRAT